jgi:hypothetical protein
MSNHGVSYRPVHGKTYSLFADGEITERYYAEIQRLADMFLEHCPDLPRLHVPL